MPNTAKQEAIRKAYGEYWGKMSAELQYIALRSDGWIQMRDCIKELGEEFSLSQYVVTEPHFGSYKQRPQSLQGIENNLGWIMIESEEDLPKEDKTECHLIINNDRMELNGGFRRYSKETFYFYNAKGEGFLIDSVSHWQPIVKPEKPIY